MGIRMLTDLADVLRAAGLDVLELPGWKDRTETDGSFDPIGVLLHHDGMGLGFNSDPSDDLNVPHYMSQNGINGAQLWISHTGTVVILAAGRKWHAGKGNGWGDIPADSGNRLMIGIETDHTFGNPWTPAQLHAINVASKALVDHYGFKASNCCGHKEYAPTRKVDPESFDLNAWRAYLAAPTPPPAPVWEDDMALSPDALKQLSDLIDARIKAALTDPNTLSFAVQDVAQTPNVYNVSVVQALARLVRLEALVATGDPLQPHPAAAVKAVKK